MPDWLIPSRVYDVLKWLGLIVLPALAVFVNTVGPAWGWTHVDAIVTTLNALGILAGARFLHARLTSPGHSRRLGC
ncbi:holin [Bifidobacterium longum subsp. longum]|nr:phage holin [Bifidobacterium longum]UNL66442.1 holin [Bifidobacterium longum subsp. longum]